MHPSVAPSVLGVAAHRAVVEPEALGRGHPRLAVEGQPPAVLLHQHVRDHRGSEQAAREQLLGHRGGDQLEHGLLVAACRARRRLRSCRSLARRPRARDRRDGTRSLKLSSKPMRSALPSSAGSRISTRSSGRSSSARLRRPVGLGRVLAAGGGAAGSLAESVGGGAASASSCVASASSFACVCRELHLQLRDVDALGLRDVDAPTKKLQLLLELLVGAAQLVALGGDLRERRASSVARHERRAGAGRGARSGARRCW